MLGLVVGGVPGPTGTARRTMVKQSFNLLLLSIDIFSAPSRFVGAQQIPVGSADVGFSVARNFQFLDPLDEVAFADQRLSGKKVGGCPFGFHLDGLAGKRQSAIIVVGANQLLGKPHPRQYVRGRDLQFPLEFGYRVNRTLNQQKSTVKKVDAWLVRVVRDQFLESRFSFVVMLRLK